MYDENNQQYNAEQEHDRAYNEMMKLFEKEGFFTRMKRMANGLGQPKDSGEYKFAKLQLQRLSGPFLAVVLPLIGVLFLLSLETKQVEKPKTQAVEIVEMTEMEIEEEPPPPPEPVEFEPIDTDFDGPVSDFNTPDMTSVVNDAPYSPKPAEANTVAIVSSPIMMPGIVGSRSPGQRGSALGRFGGSAAGEATVMRALRWLKSKQNENGSWGNQHQTAMTGLAILTYLAHGETPSLDCPEFGETVQKGIKWLTDNVKENGVFKQVDHNLYSQLIGAYALSESYAMTRVPAVKDAAEKAIRKVISGQQEGGGFDYKLDPNSERNDLSYSGWATQAIKAAHLAQLDIKKTLDDGTEVDLLHDAYEKCKNGIRANAISGGESGFGYTPDSKSHRGLTGVGVLCLQLLGDGNCSEVKNALGFLDACTFSFDDWSNQPYNKGDNPSPIYYWYYITQAKFHTGGDRWKRWNAMFQKELIAKQNVIKEAIADPTGKMRDIGYWQSPSESESFRGGGGDALWKDIMDTCLCTLQLEVYYRYLPSFQTPTVTDSKVVEEDEDEITIAF